MAGPYRRRGGAKICIVYMCDCTELFPFTLQVHRADSMTIKVSAKFDAGNAEVNCTACPCGFRVCNLNGCLLICSLAGGRRHRPSEYSVEDQARSILQRR